MVEGGSVPVQRWSDFVKSMVAPSRFRNVSSEWNEDDGRAKIHAISHLAGECSSCDEGCLNFFGRC